MQNPSSKKQLSKDNCLQQVELAVQLVISIVMMSTGMQYSQDNHHKANDIILLSRRHGKPIDKLL